MFFVVVNYSTDNSFYSYLYFNQYVCNHGLCKVFPPINQLQMYKNTELKSMNKLKQRNEDFTQKDKKKYGQL
jgi:hypothetical protein